ncbi:MAG: hypothetical protein AB1916_14565 [Thermodesulfobacteriota bacterium]
MRTFCRAVAAGLGIALALLAGAAWAAAAAEEEERSRRADAVIVGVWGGWLSAEGFREWFIPPLEMEDHYLAGISLGRELVPLGQVFVVEAELYGAHHWGPFRGDSQAYQELAGLGLLRWREMPWDRSLDTSIAFGLGVSGVTEDPEHERRINGSTDQVLCAMALEFTAALPSLPEWELAFRVHHRSGVWGLIGDVKGGSNYLTLGLKRRF